MLSVSNHTERQEMKLAGEDGAPEIATSAFWRATMRAARNAAGISQAELGRRVGLSQNVISQIESGEQEASASVLAICRVLKIAPPFAAFADELDQRWYQAGQLMRRRNERMFEAQVRAMEAFADQLAASDEGM